MVEGRPALPATQCPPPAALRGGVHAGPQPLTGLTTLFPSQLAGPWPDGAALAERFQQQDQFMLLERMVDGPLLDRLLASLPALEARVHRSLIPGHKKGGSISRFDLDAATDCFRRLYHDPGLLAFLSALTGRRLQPCPGNDPHGCALYCYTESGDHIGWHYDTSYYRGERYTVLLGLVDRSSCHLEYELFRKSAGRPAVRGEAAIAPGTLVVFNGDRLHHRITPLGEDETRIVLSLEYVTDPRMHPFARLFSDMKDAFAYFGPRQVFFRRWRT